MSDTSADKKTTDSSGNTSNTDSSGNTANTKTTTTTSTSTYTVNPADNYFDPMTSTITFGFLVLYFAIYLILGFFIDKSQPGGNHRLGNLIDMIVLLILIGLLAYLYLQSPSTFFKDSLENTRIYLNNYYSIFEIIAFIIFLYLGVYILGMPMTNGEKSVSLAFLETKAYIFLAVLIAVQFFKYVLNIPIVDMIFGDWEFLKSKVTPESTTDGHNTSNVKKEEVFNVSNNLYTFDDAKAVCSSMDARLATYDEIEDAYNHGAEWSSYGWSEGQHAYFPTQKSTWQKLQSVKGHEHDLGRPGVNGGYFKNPYIKFGVNCFGVKPEMTDKDKAYMQAKQSHVYPKTLEDKALDAKVAFWKANKDKYMVINGYNENKWSAST